MRVRRLKKRLKTKLSISLISVYAFINPFRIWYYRQYGAWRGRNTILQKIAGKEKQGKIEVYCMHFSPRTIEVNCKIQCYHRWVCFNLFRSEETKVRVQLHCHAGKTINILNCRMLSTS